MIKPMRLLPRLDWHRLAVCSEEFGSIADLVNRIPANRASDANASPRLEYSPRSFRAGHVGLLLPLAASFGIPLGIALLAPIKLSRCPIP